MGEPSLDQFMADVFGPILGAEAVAEDAAAKSVGQALSTTPAQNAPSAEFTPTPSPVPSQPPALVPAVGPGARLKSPMAAKKPAQLASADALPSLKRSRGSDLSTSVSLPPLLRESQLCLVRKSATGVYWPAVVLPYPSLTDTLPPDATYYVNLVDAFGTNEKEVASSRCWVMYRDVLPFDASYKPQPGRLVGRNVKQKPGPLVGWLARDASSLADFAEAMEMASMLATTQLQDDGSETAALPVPVPTLPITLLGPAYAPVGVFKAHELFVCGNFVVASNRSQSVLEIIRIRCADVPGHRMSTPCSSVDCCWLECKAYPILHPDDFVLGASSELVKTVFIRPHEIKSAVKVSLPGGKVCAPEYALTDPAAVGYVLASSNSDKLVRVHIPSLHPGLLPHGVSVACSLCKRCDDMFGPLMLYKSTSFGAEAWFHLLCLRFCPVSLSMPGCFVFGGLESKRDVVCVICKQKGAGVKCWNREHTDHMHFHCLMIHGYPGRCDDLCFVAALIRHLIRRGNCWAVPPQFGRCTGWIIDYNFLTGMHTVLLDTGVEVRLEFCGDPTFNQLPLYNDGWCCFGVDSASRYIGTRDLGTDDAVGARVAVLNWRPPSSHSRILIELPATVNPAAGKDFRARNFKLLDELEEAEKPKGDRGADISLGLASRDDLFLTNWNASIVQAPGGSSEPRIWFLSLVAGERYPDVPPTIRFTSRVTLDCVDASGLVRPDRLPYLASWNRTKSMFGALSEIKALIARASRSQPPDGSSY